MAVTGLTDIGVSRVAGEIRAMGRSALSLSGDATKAADMERIAQQVLTELGRVDTLINCVGDAIRKPVAKLPGTSTEEMTEQEWHHLVVVTSITGSYEPGRLNPGESMTLDAKISMIEDSDGTLTIGTPNGVVVTELFPC